MIKQRKPEFSIDARFIPDVVGLGQIDVIMKLAKGYTLNTARRLAREE